MVRILILAICCLFVGECFAQTDSVKYWKQIAKDYESRAKLAEELADRMMHLALAKAIAYKSLEVNDNQLRGSLALQAYNFNKWFNGYENDQAIYNGLYSALKKFDFEAGQMKMEELAKQLCARMNRNMTKEEWGQYVSNMFPYEATCKKFPLRK